jgi:hypothetical protein
MIAIGNFGTSALLPGMFSYDQSVPKDEGTSPREMFLSAR